MTSPYRIKRDRYSSHRITANYLISLAAKKKVNILDLGCDVGFIGRLSDNPNIDFTGADISEWSLKNLPEMYTTRIKLDLNDKNWRISKTYDAIVFTDVIEHLISPVAAMKQITGFLKTDGVLILSVPNFVFILTRLVILFGLYPQQSRGLFDKTHLHNFTLNKIRNLLKDSGFEIIDEKYTNPPIYLAAPRLFTNPVGDSLYYILHFLVKLMPELFAYQFIIFAKRTK